MTKEEKYKLAALAIDHAIKSGAGQASVSIDESISNEIEIRDQKIDKLTESNRSGLNISLYVDKKYSSHSTNNLKKNDLFRFIAEAVAATKFLAEDEFRMLPEEELYYKGGGKEPVLLDPGLESVSAASKIQLANALMDEAFGKDERIISVSSFYSDSISNRVYVTSNGFKGDSARSDISLYTTVSVKSDTGRPSDYWYETAQFFDKLVKTGIGAKALDRTLKKIGPKKIASGRYPMLLENRVAGNLLGPMFNALNGYSIYQKQSFLADKLNQKIASGLLSVWDDPLMQDAPGSRLFDDEGLAAMKRTIVEDGILRGFYIDTYYGRKLKMNPTSGSSSNVIVKTGTRDLEGMTQNLKRGIIVSGFNGGNCNGSTGDFSYGIEGFLVENGKIVHPVNEMNISGNMKDFWLNLAETGNDFREGSTYRIPSLLVDNVEFSGI